jgi:hypothetical protein
MTESVIDGNVWELDSTRIMNDHYIVKRIFYYNSSKDTEYASSLFNGIALPEKLIFELKKKDKKIINSCIKKEIPILRKDSFITGEFWSIDIQYAKYYAKKTNTVL